MSRSPAGEIPVRRSPRRRRSGWGAIPLLASVLLGAAVAVVFVLLPLRVEAADAPSAAALETIENSYRSAAAEFHDLREEEATAGAPVRWRGVGEAFLAVHKQAGASRRAKDALYSAGLAFRSAYLAGGEWRDLSRAMNAFREFVRQFPRDRLADDALMHQAALLERGYDDLPGARAAYKQVTQDYPEGDQRDAALRALQLIEQRIRQQAQEKPTRMAKPAKGQGSTERPATELLAGVRDSVHEGVKGGTAAAGGGGAGGVPSTAGGDDAMGGGGRSAGAEQTQATGLAQIEQIQHLSASEWTRVIVTTDREVAVRYEQLAAAGGQAPRLYFDVSDTRPGDAVAAVTAVNDGVLKRIRVHRRGNSLTRIVLDLTEIDGYEVKRFTLDGQSKFVVDLFPRGSPAPVGGAAGVAAAGGSSAVASATRSVAAMAAGSVTNGSAANGGAQGDLSLLLPEGELAAAARVPVPRVRNVMLDPGHGGRDPGAVAFGLMEKDQVLLISKALRELIRERHPGINVALTREDDRFIPLGERPDLAREFGADLFVSVHLNSHEMERFSGVETYFLNQTDDVSALSVAARENAGSDHSLDDLNEILRDLLQDANIIASSGLARTVQDSLVGTLRERNGGVRNLGVKQAPFVVLLGAEMPGILVEAGFMSNRGENQRLRQPEYLQRIAEGIYAGLRRYIEEQKVAADAANPSTGSAPRS